MFNTLVLALALVNFTADLGSTVEYPHQQNLFLQSSFHQTYFDDYTYQYYEIQSNFNFTCNYAFNTAIDYKLTFSSFELDSYVYVYDEDYELIDTLHQDSYLNNTLVTYSSSDISNFKLVPASTQQGFAYRFMNNTSQVGYFFINDISYNVDQFTTFQFSSEQFSRLLLLVQNTITASETYASGASDGYTLGYNDGASDGYQEGYSHGYQEASDQDTVAVTIFTGICEVGLLPVNVFLGILNFEVFGINIGAFVASLMTIAIVVIVLRVVLGGKGKDD